MFNISLSTNEVLNVNQNYRNAMQTIDDQVVLNIIYFGTSNYK